MLQIWTPEVTRSDPPRHSNPSILSSSLSQSHSFMYHDNNEYKSTIKLWDNLCDIFPQYSETVTSGCVSKNFKKNPKRKYLPFLKAPVIEIITTGFSLTSGFNIIFSKFSSTNSSPCVSSPSLSLLVILIICRDSPLLETSAITILKFPLDVS